MLINQRVKNLVEVYAKGKKSSFAEMIGVSKTAITDYTKLENFSSPNFEVLTKILSLFSNLSAEWLMRGEGEMLKPNFETNDTILDAKPIQPIGKKSYENITNSTVDSKVADTTITYNSGDLLKEIARLEAENHELRIENNLMKSLFKPK